MLVCDDASEDATYKVGLEYQEVSNLPLTVIRHPINLGYGGNQKSGYRWAIERELDIVVLLHGDGQYAPEVIEQLIAPLEDGSCDAVFGSRMMQPGSARRGGMPLYKYVGNRVLTSYENALASLDLTEWHSGYRAYRVDALKDIPFVHCSDGFDFDTEIILLLADAHKTIGEIPIPTYYGNEICHVSGMKYAAQVAGHVTRHRLGKLGFGGGHRDTIDEDPYELKMTPNSSHGRLLVRMGQRLPQRVLDVGCSDGRFAEKLRSLGHGVTGVDVVKHDGVAERLDAFVEADLNHGLPTTIGNGYDIVLAADVLEHTIDPLRLLNDIRRALRTDGTLLVSIPNFGHWYPRARVALGRFDYDRRGILDAGHVRFFTRRSFERLVARAGYRIVDREVVGLPVEVMERGGSAPDRVARAIRAIDDVGVSAWPTMFGYQFIYELRPLDEADAA